MAINLNSIVSKSLNTINDEQIAIFETTQTTWDKQYRFPIEIKSTKKYKIKLQPYGQMEIKNVDENLINSYSYFMFFINAPIYALNSVVKESHHIFKIDTFKYRIIKSTFISDANWSSGVCCLIET